MTEVDLGLDEVVDLDKVLECTALGGCSHPATHQMTHLSPCVVFYCDDHAQWMNLRLHLHAFFRCGHCGAEGIPKFVIKIFPI